MIDFAIDAERSRNLSPHDAIFEACLMRFRPIMMTTMAALLGALPLAIGVGDGAELRQPLGISIVGGLIVSQMLTLYTTPVVYLYLDSFRIWWNKATWGERIAALPSVANLLINIAPYVAVFVPALGVAIAYTALFVAVLWRLMNLIYPYLLWWAQSSWTERIDALPRISERFINVAFLLVLSNPSLSVIIAAIALCMALLWRLLRPSGKVETWATYGFFRLF
jgi:hypothetical protein